MQTIPQKIGKKQNESTHTHIPFLNTFRVVHEQKAKKMPEKY